MYRTYHDCTVPPIPVYTCNDATSIGAGHPSMTRVRGRTWVIA
jgi:hypothetical protein